MSSKTKRDDPPAIRPAPLIDALSERYVAYALSTIMSRSLPDVRDGLKPVHRRLLYAMRVLRLDPRSGFKKCARVVGDVIGKFHPHGDTAVYDALVRLAQDFAARYPLVEGQGNFGNIDGDNAAAMRYTEARLTEVAEALLEGIDEDTVDFRDTYDGEDSEPVVLPAAFPNLLANGASGIAVGMATSIPPHNVDEICGALLHLLKSPNARTESLVKHVPGPDFPTGGILVEPRESVIQAYETGRGAFRLRCKWQVERLKHSQYHIVVTEIPYQVTKARLIEKVAEQMSARKLPWLADIRDESAEDVRIVLEPKSRGIEPEALMETLFRLTDFEVRVSLNLNVLDADHVPRVMSLREALQAFIDHRFVVLQRRSRFRLDKIERRLEILDGLLIAYLNIDEVIRIIREEDDPKAEMIARWDLTDLQAESILNMRLRNLRKLEEFEIRKEHKALKKERTELKALLRDSGKQRKVIEGEFREIRKSFGAKTELGRRRTEIGDAPSAEVIPIDAMIVAEPVTVVCSEKGWIRVVKGHIEPDAELKFKDGDRDRFRLHAKTNDRIVVFATNGRFYTLACERLPGGRGLGEPLRMMIDLGNDHDVVTLMVHRSGRGLLVASSEGRGFVVEEDSVIAQTRAGKQVLNVSGDEEAVVCVPVVGDTVATVGENHKMTVFPLDELPVMTRGRGVIMQRFKDGGLSDARTFVLNDGLSWQSGGRTRTVTDLAPWYGKRGAAGRLAPKGFPRSHKFG